MQTKQGIIMIDVKKAFDSPKHNVIASILQKVGMPAKLTRLVALMQANA